MALWLAVFLSGFVLREPAPYELYLAFLTVVWMLFGLKLRAAFGPLIICMLLYIAGGVAALPMASETKDASIYIATSGFLAVTAIFYAAILAERPDRTVLIERAYVASALLVACFGIAGYFHLFPGAGMFTLYDRARGTFEDPNVFGPFLVLPTILLIRHLLVGNASRWLVLPLPILILTFGIFLSFSRGAWGVLVASCLIVYVLLLITERNPVRRLRLIILGALGLVAVVALLGVALSFDSIGDMFEQRAKLVQSYDGARLGRFARYSLGFHMVMERPLGLGAMEFHNYFPEDEHNVYLKGFTTYGWLGGITYLVMVGWTFARLFPLLFKPRPWTPFVHCLFAVLVSHALLAIIIDTDHWRHVYMLFGLSWGLIAADRLERCAFQKKQRANSGQHPINGLALGKGTG
ncbi:MAG: O-antigen ligase family protein [Rhodobacteraceae bacterium]|nr:O-antigen ligase family protein [Paracoccaceae bacterium]